MKKRPGVLEGAAKLREVELRQEIHMNRKDEGVHASANFRCTCARDQRKDAHQKEGGYPHGAAPLPKT